MQRYDVLKQVAAVAYKREWHVAIHPYSLVVGGPVFSATDQPFITFGTLNVLTGWLQAYYSTPSFTPTVRITEVSSHQYPTCQRGGYY